MINHLSVPTFFWLEKGIVSGMYWVMMEWDAFMNETSFMISL
jgi:hypothetical protein